MQNPILKAMNNSGNNNLLLAISMARSLMMGKTPEAAYQMLMQSNPKFRNFVNENRGKTPEQIASENGIDLEQITAILK